MAFSATSHVPSAACVAALRGGGSEAADDLEETASVEEPAAACGVRRCSTVRVVRAMLRVAKIAMM